MKFTIEIPDDLPVVERHLKMASLIGLRHEDIANALGLHRVTVTTIIRKGKPEATFDRIMRFIEESVDRDELVSRIDGEVPEPV